MSETSSCFTVESWCFEERSREAKYGAVAISEVLICRDCPAQSTFLEQLQQQIAAEVAPVPGQRLGERQKTHWALGSVQRVAYGEEVSKASRFQIMQKVRHVETEQERQMRTGLEPQPAGI